MSEDDVYKVIEVLGERITDLSKSYRVLNDCHHRLEIRFTKMESKLETIVQIAKFFISPALGLLLLSEILKLVGITK